MIFKLLTEVKVEENEKKVSNKKLTSFYSYEMSTKQGSVKLPIDKEAHVIAPVPSKPRTASTSGGQKRTRTSPIQSTTTPDNIFTTANTSLRMPTTPTGKSS